MTAQAKNIPHLEALEILCLHFLTDFLNLKMWHFPKLFFLRDHTLMTSSRGTGGWKQVKKGKNSDGSVWLQRGGGGGWGWGDPEKMDVHGYN